MITENLKRIKTLEFGKGSTLVKPPHGPRTRESYLPTHILVWVRVPSQLISIIMSSKQMLSSQKYFFENENIYKILGFCHSADILTPNGPLTY